MTRTIQNYIDRKDLVTKNRSGRPKLTNDVLIKLIESMPRRVEAVIENNGWPTRY